MFVSLVLLLVALAPAPPASAQTPGLTPAAAAITLPLGGSGSIPLTLHESPGTAFDLAHTIPAGVLVSLTPASGVVPAEGSVPVTLTLSGVSQSGAQTIVVHAVTDQAVYSSVISLIVPSPSDITLTPGMSVVGILSTGQHTLTLHNPAAYAQSVQLGFSGSAGWPTGITPTQVTLAPGASQSVVVSTTRPLTATGSHTVTVFAAVTGGTTFRIARVRFTHHRALMPVLSWPGPNVIDAYEPDNSCAQFSQIAVGQVQTRTFGGNAPDTDVIRLTLAGPGSYTLSFAGTEYRAEPRARIWTQQTCGSGNSQVYTSTGGLPVNVPLVLPPAPPYSYTLWISMTSPHYGPGTGYVISAAAGTLMTALGSAPDTIVLRPGPDMSR